MSGYAQWNPAATYTVYDIVDYDAKVWVSLANLNLNKQPDISPAFWSQIGGGGAISTINGGAGITVVGVGSSRTVSTNLASADGRLTITPGTGSQLVLTNTGPFSVGAGNGLTASGANLTGITLAMPNVGTPAAYAYPTSITTDAQGRVTAAVAGSAPVASVTAGTNITNTGTATNPILNATATGISSKVVFSTPGASTFTFPLGGTYNVEYVLIGGGGGGGGGGQTTPVGNGSGAGGGAGAETKRGAFIANGGDGASFTVGAGGGGGGSDTGGGSGGNSTFTAGGGNVSDTSSGGGGGGSGAGTGGGSGATGAYGGGGGGGPGGGGSGGAGTIASGQSGSGLTGGFGGFGAPGGSNVVYGGGGGGGGYGAGAGGNGPGGNGNSASTFGAGGGGGASAGLSPSSGGSGGSGAGGVVMFIYTLLA
jgi:hypothetical protein